MLPLDLVRKCWFPYVKTFRKLCLSFIKITSKKARKLSFSIVEFQNFVNCRGHCPLTPTRSAGPGPPSPFKNYWQRPRLSNGYSWELYFDKAYKGPLDYYYTHVFEPFCCSECDVFEIELTPSPNNKLSKGGYLQT